MKAFLLGLFFRNWPRKAISIVFSVIIWLIVNHSLTATKIINHIPIRIINIPSGKTIVGLQNNGLLSKKISLTLTGNKRLLEEMNSNDLEIVIDASDKKDEWLASITKKNLISLNPELDLTKGIDRIVHPTLSLRLANVVTEKITIYITKPIGEAPRDYQFLDVWPYRLSLSISGPEDIVKRIKTREQKLTFNLNDISKAELDVLAANSDSANGDVISFFVPDQWKQVALPLISEAPIEIDDPQAKTLRIDFVRCNLMPIESKVPVSLFFPPELSATTNPENCSIGPSDLIEIKHGIPLITMPLFAKGVSRLFIQIIRDMLEVTIIAAPKPERGSFQWSLQLINPRDLENTYVSTLINDVSDDAIRNLQPSLREEYLRNRFRSYMNRFQFFKADDTKLELYIEQLGNQIIVKEGSP